LNREWVRCTLVGTLAQPREIVVLATYKLALGMEAGPGKLFQVQWKAPVVRSFKRKGEKKG